MEEEKLKGVLKINTQINITFLSYLQKREGVILLNADIITEKIHSSL